MVYKLFDKRTGKEVNKGELMPHYGIYITNNDIWVTLNRYGCVTRVRINKMPEYEIREIKDDMENLEWVQVKATQFDYTQTTKGTLEYDVIPGQPTRILMTADELRVNVPEGVKPFEFKDAKITPNPKVYTPLANVVMYLIDEGYSVKGIYDHDRTGFRSIRAKKKDKTTLIAHIEIIDGLRYVRNSILNMLRGE